VVFPDNNTINVSTGEVRVVNKTTRLVANGIGSCIVIAVIDPVRLYGGLAHIMLPGTAPYFEKNKLKYAKNAIDELFNRMKMCGSKKRDFIICLIGGGNVLSGVDDKICMTNINSVYNCLKKYKIAVQAKSLGGNRRRRVRIDLKSRSVYCSVGDKGEKLLYRIEN
jgi:chemotaxis protein CheD